jgi:hypothetical protein
VRALKGEQGYSYIFDGMSGSLDHALASPSMLAQIVDVAHWHINADEPEVLSYNEEYNSGPYFTSDPVRFSDHDPCLVGLNLGSAAETDSDSDMDTDIGMDTAEDDTASDSQSDSETTSGEVEGDTGGETETDESSIFGEGCGLSLVGGEAHQTNSLLKVLALF